VFEGVVENDDAALAHVKKAPARRVLASVTALQRHAHWLGNVPPRKELKGKKMYARDTGHLESYMVATAAVSGIEMVTYEQALAFDLAEEHDVQALRGVALGKKATGRVRSPDEHEREIRERHAAEWAESRATTTPGPFGDLPRLEKYVGWIEEYGLENAIDVEQRISIGAQGYGRPSEDSERTSYAFVGIVALWLGRLPQEVWPAALEGRLPARPEAKRLAVATEAARVLAAQIVTRDSALRMIWDGATGSETLQSWVDRSRAALER